MTTLKDHFLLDPDIVFLNHGSFGATPRPVFDAYQEWQRRLERQPVLFLGRQFPELDHQARASLAAYLHVQPADLAFVPNATLGVNLVARSLQLKAGDEILTTDHEYGACDNVWDFLCRRTGAVYVRQPIPLPVHSESEIVETLWQGVTTNTRLIFLSHITSPTALIFPVKEICQRARHAGIPVLIDGAHAPGQIPLDLAALGADFYTGNCHKWMMSPKGAAFLYTRPDRQDLIEPLVVSWGYCATPANSSGSRYTDLLQWTGTHDPAAALAVPAAIQFQQDHDWENVRQQCHELLGQALYRLAGLTGLEPHYPPASQFYRQMAAAPLPLLTSHLQFQKRLYDEFQIEVPLIEWRGQHLIRVSVQGYNTSQDIERLLAALTVLIPQFER